MLYPSLFISICYLTTNFFSTHKETATVLVNLACYFAYPYILWHCIDNKTRLIKLLNYIYVFFFFAALYGLFELITGENYIHSFLLNNNGMAGTFMQADEVGGLRYGIKRCFSIFPYISTYGFIMIYVFILLYVARFNYSYLKNKKYLLLLLILLPICIFSSGTRSCIITFIFCFAYFFFQKDFYKSIFFKILMIGLVLLTPLVITFLNQIYLSIVSTDSVEGSSLLMRLNQLDTSLSYWSQSPIWGNGRLYTWNYAIPNSPQLLGAESIWFTLLIDYGIMGCVSYIFLIISLAIGLFKYKSIFILIPISFFIAKTLGTIISIEFSTLLVFSIILIKLHTYQIQTEK